MTRFETKHLPSERDVVAADGSDVRILLGVEGGEMAHFELRPGQVSRAVTHRTIGEIWFFISGRGEMWREQEGKSQVVDVYPGVCLTVPLGTRFQFRSAGEKPLVAVGAVIPPWPGEGEAIVVDGPWQPTVGGE